jgi:signal transduction histidine kinase
MFKYLLAFGDTGEGILHEEYDAGTLLEQMLSEHILLLSESGYEVELDESELEIPEGTVVKTDAENLMRIIDNVFSNLYKYADIGSSVKIRLSGGKERVVFECENRIRTDDFVAESNHIGLKTSERLASFVAEEFSYRREDERFISRLVLRVYIPENGRK